MNFSPEQAIARALPDAGRFSIGEALERLPVGSHQQLTFRENLAAEVYKTQDFGVRLRPENPSLEAIELLAGNGSPDALAQRRILALANAILELVGSEERQAQRAADEAARLESELQRRELLAALPETRSPSTPEVESWLSDHTLGQFLQISSRSTVQDRDRFVDRLLNMVVAPAGLRGFDLPNAPARDGFQGFHSWHLDRERNGYPGSLLECQSRLYLAYRVIHGELDRLSAYAYREPTPETVPPIFQTIAQGAE